MGSYYSNDCEPCPLKPAPYRIVRLFHGWTGWIMCLWLFIVAITVWCMFIDKINNAPMLIPGLLIATIVVAVFFMLLNIFYFGPYNFTRKVNTIGECKKLAPLYNRKVARDLQFHNDEWLMRKVLLGSAFILLFIAIFLGENGLNSFQPLPGVFTNDDVMNYVKVKGFQLAVLGLAGMAGVIFFESHSDFLYRTLTAMNNQFGDAVEGGELPMRTSIKSDQSFFG